MSAWRKSPDDRVLPPEQLPDGRVRVVVQKRVNVTDDYVNAFMPAIGDLFVGDASMTGTRSRFAGLTFMRSDIVHEMSAGTSRTYRLTFETAGTTPVELYPYGVARDIPGTRTTVNSKTIRARVWTHRYLVRGNGDTPANVVELNETYYASIPSGGIQKYFVSQSCEDQNDSPNSILVRIYVELPISYTYSIRENFNFPGMLKKVTYGYTEPMTRETTVVINESYDLSAITPTALDYNPVRWAKVGGSYTPTSTGVAQDYGPISFPGCLSNGYTGSSGGSPVYFTGYNNEINPIEVSVWSLNSTGPTYVSDPANYPSGANVVSSMIEPWDIPGVGRSGLFKRTNKTVTF